MSNPQYVQLWIQPELHVYGGYLKCHPVYTAVFTVRPYIRDVITGMVKPVPVLRVRIRGNTGCDPVYKYTGITPYTG